MLMGSIRHWHEATLQYCFILHVPPLKEKREKVLNQETDKKQFQRLRSQIFTCFKRAKTKHVYVHSQSIVFLRVD